MAPQGTGAPTVWRDGSGEQDREGLEAAQHDRVAVAGSYVAPTRLDHREAFEQPVEHHLSLGAGERGTQAEVDPRAEAHDRSRAASDVEALRVGECARVAVRRSQQGDDL